MSTKVEFKTPTTAEMLESGVHIGHQARHWNPAMEKYIFAVKSGKHIIDLGSTETNLAKALQALFDISSTGGKVIFVSTKKQAIEVIETEAQRCGALYVTERWLGGTLTNLPVIKRNIKKLLDYKSSREKGEFGKYTKKERLMLDREIEKLERNYGGLTGLNAVPTALFVIDARREKTAIKEANKMKVPVFALVDTNTAPEGVSYVIPGNDDGLRSISLIVKAVADALEAGYAVYAKKLAEKGLVETPVVVTDSVDTPVVVSASESPASTQKAGKKAIKAYENKDTEVDEAPKKAKTSSNK